MLATTNYAAVVRPLQILIMVLSLLFFARVMRVSMVAARPPEAVAPRQSRRRSAALRLEFLEPADLAGQSFEVKTDVVCGRGEDCDVTLTDTFMSTRHARFIRDDGDLAVEDMGSTNGTYVNQERIKSRTRLDRGDIVQIGGVLLEVVR